ncbi:division/cell wall cluster transcriptional repressor MraZ [Candidatus Berkelbacteria bacterium]|nr:division/cell wall cluster transcriptional repressor MraZ [Candidatus Berkelbacteria bacterium]
MFVGEYAHSMDAKGRLSIPAKMRRDLDEGAVVTRGIDNCLFVYPKNEWLKLAEKIAALPLADPRARSFSRLMLAGAMEVEFDKLGRILLPGYLRDYAKLAGEVVVAGVFNRVEVWEKSAWETYKSQHSVEEDLSNLNI